MIEFTTAVGEIGVYKKHIPLTTVLAPGVVKIHKTGEDDVIAAVHSGFAEILPDKVTLLAEIEDQYPNLEFDLSEYDQHLEEFFNAVYKFFIVNIQKLMYIFIREYIYSRKNQKVLVAEYLNLKLPNYPKEQYGKKEYYILITKLNSIIDDIKDYDLKLKKFIDYIERSGKTPMYVKKVKEYLDQGLIHDKGVVDDFFHKFKRSDEYDQALCKLQMAITENIINPYLEENGVMELRLPPIDPMDDDPSDEEDDADAGDSITE